MSGGGRAQPLTCLLIMNEEITFLAKNSFRISQELYEGRLFISSDLRGELIDVVFVKVARREDAERIFRRTAAASDGVVLKPWRYWFSGEKEFCYLPKDAELRKGIWTLCYDHFENNLKDWTNLVKGNVGYYDKLKLPIKTGNGCRLKEFWRDSIRELIKGVVRIHSKGSYHGGLGSENGREWQKKADITDLLGMLNNWFESILTGGQKKLAGIYDEFVKKVAGHPFLLEADERMRLFDHYEAMRNGPITSRRVHSALARSTFDNFKSWNSTSTLNNMDNFTLGVYNHRNSSASRKTKKLLRIKKNKETPPHQKNKTHTGDVEDLLRYLRNLYHHYHHHGLAAGSMEDVDRGVTTHFRGFLELLYMHLEL
ncbi:unnamed protein product [Prunus armeniaca]|uniref:KEN domain-containing protein n=1 Tax=Prunus armeniaca TaxID=36596 RepID=A0A6J5TXB5_PRUAR|nr:unnamed protein product [Prunus armeniaca]